MVLYKKLVDENKMEIALLKQELTARQKTLDFLAHQNEYLIGVLAANNMAVPTSEEQLASPGRSRGESAGEQIKEFQEEKSNSELSE